MFPAMTLEPPTPCQLLEPGMELGEEISNLNHSLQPDQYLSRDWSSFSTERLSYDSSAFSDSSSRAGFSSPPASPSRPSSVDSSPHRKGSSGRVKKADADFVKRPLNSFMLYRKDHQHCIPTNNHQSISRIIGDMWRKETAETKNRYDNLAKSERERHLLEHPGYKFQPRKRRECKVAKGSPKLLKKHGSIESDEVDHGTIQFKHVEGRPGTLQPSTRKRPQAQTMERTPIQHNSWVSHMPFPVSGAYPPTESEASGSLDTPDQSGLYGGMVDYFSFSTVNDTLPAVSPLRDPPEWHGVQPISIRPIAAPMQRLPEMSWHQIDGGEYTLAQGPSTSEAESLRQAMSPSFLQWEEQQIHLHQQRRDLDDGRFGSSLTSQFYDDEALFQAIDLNHPGYFPDYNAEFQPSGEFAPNQMHSYWEMESIMHQ